MLLSELLKPSVKPLVVVHLLVLPVRVARTGAAVHSTAIADQLNTIAVLDAIRCSGHVQTHDLLRRPYLVARVLLLPVRPCLPLLRQLLLYRPTLDVAMHMKLRLKAGLAAVQSMETAAASKLE